MSKIRVGILGIGGTGGFFGGKLARHYSDDKNTEIVFIARNEVKEKILEKGLRVDSIEGDFDVRPDLVSDNTDEIGQLDIMLVCVKSYSLEKAINQFKGNVKQGGAVISIQNLVNQAERIERLLPTDVALLEGCAYIISNTIGPGHVMHKGGPATLFFGRSGDINKFESVRKVFVDAGIKATLSSDISEIIWKKFLFISPIAVACSYFSCTIGELRDDLSKLNFLRALMDEVFELIKAKNINLSSEEIDNHLQFLNGLPENGKPSMQLDIESNRQAETDSLIDYVLLEAKKHDLTPVNYRKAAKKLNYL